MKYLVPYRRRIALPAITLLLGAGYFASDLADTEITRDLVPDFLHVSKIFYSKSEKQGFGPGGELTEFLVFKLPDEVAKEIQQSGINYFSNHHQQNANTRSYNRPYIDWTATPALLCKPDDRDYKCEPNVSAYLWRRGWAGVDVDQALEGEINAALAAPGSYFAESRGGGGILIVIPGQRRVVYMYSGG